MRSKLLLLSMFAMFATSTVMADVRIDEISFPDANFRNFILKQSYGSDGVLTSDEIAEITTIDVSSRNIQSLKGIGYFTAVSTLNCKTNQLTTLDLSKNTALNALDCSSNQLTTLDLLLNFHLYRVDCSSNRLTTLKVSSCTQMTELRCQTNQLTALDVSKNYDLMTLYCSNNQLTALNVSNNSKLTSLYCENNQLTELTMGKNTHLTSLTCSNNKMTTLDLSGCTSLRTLYCMNGQLTSLNVANTKLTDMYCESNQLTALDLSGLSTLTSLYCADNKLKTLNLSSCTKLTTAQCHTNLINNEGMDALVQHLPSVSGGSLNVVYGYSEGNVMTTTQVADAKAKGWTPKAWNSRSYTWEEYAGEEPTPPTPTDGVEINPTTFPDDNFRNWAYGQPFGFDGVLKEDEIATITEISISGRQIQSLKGIEYFTALKSLSCGSNQLTELNLSKNTALRTLICQNNQLSTLDLSACKELTWITCSQNKIKGAGMDALIESLPIVMEGTLEVRYGQNDTNEMTTEQSAAAKMKGWLPKAYSPETGWVIISSGDIPIPTMVVINETTFPDVLFRNFLKSQSYGSDEIITGKEIEEITSLNLFGKNIENLKGIEYFTALTMLSCGNNKLTELDISKNTALTTLSCGNNQLTRLDVSKNVALTSIDCNRNKLTSLDISRCPELTNLACYQNQIKGTAMDSLILSLPTISSGSITVYNNSSWTWPEQNVMTTIQVANAKAKGWIPMWMDPNYGWAEYAGSVPAGIKATDNRQEAIDHIYDLQGRRITKTLRGVNIVRYNDGTTKRVIVK